MDTVENSVAANPGQETPDAKDCAQPVDEEEKTHPPRWQGQVHTGIHKKNTPGCA
ncbi:MAG: hypothetical protein ACE5IP_10055 [Terriglobia bacterium]